MATEVGGVVSQITLDDTTKVTLIASSTIFCSFLYLATYIYSRYRYPFFLEKYDASERADWCSRTASQVHSAMIVVVICCTLPWYDWSETMQTTQNLDVVHGGLCLSLGYFLYDLSLVLITLMDQWPLYVVHHLAASTPLVAVLFMGCQKFSFLITCFFLVEVTTVSVNTSFFLEGIGMESRKRYRFTVHFSFWAWILFRLAMPLVLFYLMVDRMVIRGGGLGLGFFNNEGRTWGGVKENWVAMSTEDAACTVTCSISAFLIILYCNLVFVASMAPAYLRRLRSRYDKIRQALRSRRGRKLVEKEKKNATEKKQ